MADSKISALPVSTLPLAGTEVLPIVQSGTTKKVATDDLTVKNVRSNATTGLLQVAGPASASTRVMTTPDSNFTVARTDADQTFNGNQTINAGGVYFNGATKKYYAYTDGSDNFAIVRYSLAGAYEALPMRILPSNDIVALAGNFVIGTAGKGIDFSADGQAAGMTSELLDDYEEGTWAPSVGGDATYLIQTGFYTKIGRQVTVTAKLQINVLGTGSVNVISGLPFTAGNFGYQTGSVFYYANSVSNVTMLGIATDGNSATFKISYSTGNVLTTLLAPTLFQNSTRIDFSATYQI